MQDATPAAESVPPPLPVYLAERLAREIETNVHEPGHRLLEEAVAKRFGVSRAPVREAFRILAEQEIVAIEPRRGASVRRYSADELAEIFEMRAVLYGLAVERFAERATEAALAVARERGAAIVTAGRAPDVTAEAFAAATQAFTAHVTENCGNARLVEAMRRMTRRSFRHFAIRAHRSGAHREVVMAFVTEIVEALSRRDAATAGRLARRLVERNHAELQAGLEPAEASQSGPGPQTDPDINGRPA